MIYELIISSLDEDFERLNWDRLGTFKAEDIPPGVRDCVLILFPAKDRRLREHAESIRKKKQWLFLSHVCRQLRIEYLPLIASKTQVYMAMDVAPRFMKAFMIRQEGAPLLFSHVTFIFLGGYTAKKYNVLPFMQALHCAPNLAHSIVTLDHRGTSNHWVYRMLFAPQNSLRAFVMARETTFNRIIFHPGWPKGLEIRIKHGFGEDWMLDTSWKGSDYRRTRGKRLTDAIRARQAHTRAWLQAAGLDVDETNEWDVSVGVIDD